MKTVKEILTENRETVINYYNSKIKGLYNITLKNFMLDVVNNFEKITTGEDYKKFDVYGNCQNAESRLGLMDVEIGVSYSKPYSESNHAKAVNYFGKEKVNMMANG